jgi:hypothetical protein
MPTKQQLEIALRNADAAGDTAAAKTLAQALRAGRYQGIPVQESDASDVPVVGENKAPSNDESKIGKAIKASYSLVPGVLAGLATNIRGDNPAIGALEAATAATLGGAAGLAGQMVGTAKGIGQSVIDGTYGTQAGAEAAGNEALRYSQIASKPFQPLTPTGQKYTQGLGDFFEPFAAAAPFTQELAVIGNSARAALPMGQALAPGAAQAISDISQKRTSSSNTDVPTVIEDVAPVEKTQSLANAFADAGMKNRIDEITSNISLNPERVAAAQRLGLTPPLAALSDDRALHEIAGAVAASPGSKASAELSDYHKALTETAQKLIEEAGGDLDKGLLSSQIKEKVDANIVLLADEAEKIYGEIHRRVPLKTIVNSKPLVRELNRRGDDSEKGIGGLSKVERDVYATIKGKPTYFDIDNLRKDIGESIGGIKGSYPKQSTAILKDMYGRLTELQEGVANQVGDGAGHLWNQAKGLDNSRFTLQDNSMFLFGRDLNGSVMPKVEIGLKNLARGDSKAFNNVINNVPPEMRQRVILSGLDAVLNKTVQGESGISPVQFNKWYSELSKSPTNKRLLVNNLPAGAGKRLDDIYKLSQGMQNVTNRVVRTGIVHDAWKDFDKTEGLVAKLYNTADKIDSLPILGPAIGSPTLRLGSNILKLASKEKTPAIDAADNLLSDQAFRSAVLDYQKNRNPDSSVQKNLKKSPAYRNYINFIGDGVDNGGALIEGAGLIPFLMQPSEEEENND